MDYTEYFRHKQRKLHENEQLTDRKSLIFDNCKIYITGRTDPSSEELKRLIVENGGSICNFFSTKGNATHIVCESLTLRKNELYENCKVVTPRWVVESVEKGKLLNWTNYNAIPVAGKFAPIQDPDVQWVLKERKRVNCLDPKFLENYYKNSRLHFLSACKRELRLRAAEMHNNAGLHVPSSGPQTIIHVDFDSFFVAAALKRRPELKHLPVCVSNGSDTSDVASCNYVARGHGVRNGMWVGGARKLCPQLLCLPYNFDDYRAYSKALYDTLMSLDIDYITPVSVDEALVNCTRLVQSKRYTPYKLCEHIRSEVTKKTRLAVSIGLGPNILIAKCALRMAKPDGIKYFLTEKDAIPVIESLDVGALPGVGRVTVSKLNDLGIKTVKDIQRFPQSKLEAEFGPAMACKLLENTVAQDSNDISLLNFAPKTIGVDTNWGVRLLNQDEVDRFVANVSKELVQRKDDDMLISTATIKVYEMAPGEPFIPSKYMGCGLCEVRSKTFAVDSMDELASLSVEAIRGFNIEPMRIRGVGIHLKAATATMPSTPHHANQRRLVDFIGNSPRTSPSKKQLVPLKPRKKRAFQTYTQMTAQEIDPTVFEGLPDDIQKEIISNSEEFRVKVGKESRHRFNSKSSRKSREVLSYMEVKFMNKDLSEHDIRDMLRAWISSSMSPYYEDAEEFYVYIKQVLTDDWNWLKAVDWINWIEYQVKEQGAGEDWSYFLGLLRELL